MPGDSTLTGSHPGAPILQRHIDALAGTIGERNLWRYSALVQSADYIAASLTWSTASSTSRSC